MIAATVEEMKLARIPTNALKAKLMTKRLCPRNAPLIPPAISASNPLLLTALPRLRPPPIRINTLQGVELNSCELRSPGP
jgi:hypothetical protein